MSGRVPAGVAAGHEVTAAVGHDVLRAGGNAADAACAMVLAACVAETIFTGLAGGGFATYYDAKSRSVTCHDFFVAVPGLDGTPLRRGAGIEVSFGGVSLPYDVGGPTVAVPGTPAGVEELHRTHGSIDWASVVRPAQRLASSGTPFSAAHAAILPDVQAAFLIGAGTAVYSRGEGAQRRLLRAAEPLFHHGLAETLAGYAAEGSAHIMSGSFAAEFVAAARQDGGALSALDLAAYRPARRPPREVSFTDYTVHLRGTDLDDLGGTIERLHVPDQRWSPAERARALVAALSGTARRSETTAAVAVDEAGNACAVTHSLGLGSGVWVRGVHANSMLGEGELLRGALVPGARMPSMMSPLVVTDGAGDLVLAGGSAGGSRIRPALLQVVTAVLVDGIPVPEAVAAPRLSVAGGTVHLEPGFDPSVAPALIALGYEVHQWPAPKPYFGGVSMAGRTGAAADPRRSGHAMLVT